MRPNAPHTRNSPLTAHPLARDRRGDHLRGRSWVVSLFALAALLLVPWIVLLVVVLPGTYQSAHWDIAWAGFDVLLALLLLAVAITGWRRSAWSEGAATAAATLLFIDAWFDTLTASTHTEFAIALIEAMLVELPLAVLCLLLARDAERDLPPTTERGAVAAAVLMESHPSVSDAAEVEGERLREAA